MTRFVRHLPILPRDLPAIVPALTVVHSWTAWDPAPADYHFPHHLLVRVSPCKDAASLWPDAVERRAVLDVFPDLKLTMLLTSIGELDGKTCCTFRVDWPEREQGTEWHTLPGAEIVLRVASQGAFAVLGPEELAALSRDFRPYEFEGESDSEMRTFFRPHVGFINRQRLGNFFVECVKERRIAEELCGEDQQIAQDDRVPVVSLECVDGQVQLALARHEYACTAESFEVRYFWKMPKYHESFTPYYCLLLQSLSRHRGDASQQRLIVTRIGPEVTVMATGAGSITPAWDLIEQLENDSRRPPWRFTPLPPSMAPWFDQIQGAFAGNDPAATVTEDETQALLRRFGDSSARPRSVFTTPAAGSSVSAVDQAKSAARKAAADGPKGLDLGRGA